MILHLYRIRRPKEGAKIDNFDVESEQQIGIGGNGYDTKSRKKRVRNTCQFSSIDVG